jgi:hypothetical protein
MAEGVKGAEGAQIHFVLIITKVPLSNAGVASTSRMISVANTALPAPIIVTFDIESFSFF